MNTAETPRYAGFWIRAVATAVDVVLLLLVTMPLLLWIYGLEYLDPDGPRIHGPMDLLISDVLPIVALFVFWRYRSATPGKMLVGAKIVDAATDGRPTNAQLVIRFFAYIVSTIPLGLGFLWIAFDPKKQSWHDKLARTVVVRSGRRARCACCVAND
jgi:uncharacterized RDD family membrane protein YckC